MEKMKTKWAALFPLRGGSKSIPLKNIKPLAGKPLCVWTIQAAMESGAFDAIFVSTDDGRIADTVRRWTPGVVIIDRPPEFATDTASTESVMAHASGLIDFDVLCTIQATSPLTRPDDFRRARDLFLAGGYDSLLTAVRVKRFFWNDDGSAINYDPAHRPRRQDFSGTLMENGAFYFTKSAVLRDAQSRLGGKTAVFEMREDTAIEIDEPSDWITVERLIADRCRNGKAASQIEYMFFDVDGTLTDGGMYYSNDGEYMKRFSTRDGMGLAMLRKSGVTVAIATSEESLIAQARARKLGIEHCFIGVKDKRALLSSFARERGVPLERIGFMGDDLNDLEAMRSCGFAACPEDAAPEVRQAATFVCAARGGYGAVREVCEKMIRERKETEDE
jgi:N-acylneuraminate cytidylyltransferase